LENDLNGADRNEFWQVPGGLLEGIRDGYLHWCLSECEHLTD
jgi:hypothetical protein